MIRMKLFVIAIWARFSQSLTWASTRFSQLFMHQKIRCLVICCGLMGMEKPTHLFKVA